MAAEEQFIRWRTPASEVLALNVPHALKADASSGLPVTFRVERGPAHIQAGALVITNVGTVTVKAEQPGNTKYAPVELTKTLNQLAVVLEPFSTPDCPFSNDMQFKDGFAYVCSENRGLLVFDVSDLANWIQVSAYRGGGYEFTFLQLQGNTAYAGWSGGVEILDVSNPTRPVLMGNILMPSGGYARAMQIRENVAYIAAAGTGLEIFDVSRPAQPVRLGGFRTSGTTRSIELMGNLALIATDAHYWLAPSGLLMVDVSNPRQPVLAGGYRDNGRVGDMQVQGNLVCLADYSAGLEIVDLANPAQPVQIGNFPGSFGAVELVENLAILGKSAGRDVVIDLSDPHQAVQVGGFARGSGVKYTRRIGDFVCKVGWRELGTQIFRIRKGTGQNITWKSPQGATLSLNEPHPLRAEASSGFPVNYRVTAGPAVIRNGALVVTNVGTVEVLAVQAGSADVIPTAITNVFNSLGLSLRRVGGEATVGHSFDVRVVNQLAYVATISDGLQILDVSDPTHPTRIGGYNGGELNFACQVVGKHCYVAAGPAGLIVLDVSDPAHPVRIGRYANGGYFTRVQIVGSIAYVTDGFAGLQLLDVSNPAQPVPIGSGFVSRVASDVDVVDNRAWVANGPGGLFLLDVSNPAQVALLGGPGTVYSQAIRARGSLAFSADRFGGLRIIDFANPSQPVVLGTSPSQTNATRVELNGELAFVTCGKSGLQVVDISHPTTPVTLGVFDTAGEATGLCVVGNLVYVADGSAGLQIIEVRKGTAPLLSRVTLPAQFDAKDSFSLPAKAPDGFPLTYAVDAGPATIEAGVLRFSGLGDVSLRMQTEGTELFLPATEVRTLRVLAPLLRFERSPDGSATVLTWNDPLAELQTAETPSAIWRPVPGAQSPYRATLDGGARYFRVHRP